MSDKVKLEENLDEIMKNVVKEMKKGKEISDQDINKLMSEANENVDFLKVMNDIKLAAPDNRVIFVDGNEELLYDHGEFFICDTIDSRKIKNKIKRKEATEKYIEYFIRYQLNPIIEQKNMNSISKTITKSEITKAPKEKSKTIEKKVESIKKKEPEKAKTKVVKEKKVKEEKEDITR